MLPVNRMRSVGLDSMIYMICDLQRFSNALAKMAGRLAHTGSADASALLHDVESLLDAADSAPGPRVLLS